ncbi:hypothetical protein BP6252_01288 [Coleophoma cylindrospora]|uniref:Uncharacterized protein n=1 Tax=Coleophoma cylindrospora TaxID=1849047 RepID=A0A3D8SSG3_9HELO|nr:hypothetical protein BP6252_01288 [Coleophoma cylindrospora]
MLKTDKLNQIFGPACPWPSAANSYRLARKDQDTPGSTQDEFHPSGIERSKGILEDQNGSKSDPTSSSCRPTQKSQTQSSPASDLSDPGQRTKRKEPEKEDGKEYAETVFDEALKTLRIALELESTRMFLVYAHENRDSQKGASEETAKQFIRWFNYVGTNLQSDQLPKGSDKGAYYCHSVDDEAESDILKNQMCLLPPHIYPLSAKKVILCGSELLAEYLNSELYASYREDIKSIFDNTEASTEDLVAEFHELVEVNCRKPGFHHVWTEVALLEVQKHLHQRAQKPCAEIIPLILNGNLREVLPPELLRSTKVIIKLEENTQADRHKNFFKLLSRAFSGESGVINKVQKAYQECINNPAQDSELRIRHLFYDAVSHHWHDNLRSITFGEFASKMKSLQDQTAQGLQDRARSRAQQELDEKMRKCHQALVPSGMPYDDQKTQNPLHTPGTCLWALEHPHYLQWRKNTEQRLLWISADAGCGKSVLCRTIVDKDLPEHAANASVIYFFFKDTSDDQRSGHKAIRSLLHQLISRRAGLVKHAMPLYDEMGGEKMDQASFSKLWSVFLAMVRDHDAGEVICLFDALDECREHDQEELIQSIDNFCSIQQQSPSPKVRFLITSRPYLDIQAAFKNAVRTSIGIRLDGALESDSIKKEIDLFIRHNVTEIGKQINLPPEVQQYLQKTLLGMENRTYLWLHLIIKSLPKEWPRKISEMKEIIRTLPQGIYATYESLLSKSPNMKYARKVLDFVLAAYEPLTLEELDVALSVSEETKSYQNLELEDPESLRERLPGRCGLMISIIGSKVYFIHQTVKEFLLHRKERSQGWDFTVEKSHHRMSLVCMQILSFPETIAATINIHQSLLKVFHRPRIFSPHPFLSYSAFYWADHYRDGIAVAYIVEGLIKAIIMVEGRFNYVANTIQLAAAGRHKQIFDLLLKEHFDVNQTTKGEFGTVLAAAAYGGCFAIFQSLLAKGADVNVQGGSHGTALQASCEKGHKEIAEWLVAQGADLNAQGGRLGTALQVACGEGHKEIAEFLVAKGADLNAQGDGFYGTALQAACGRGHKEIAELLVAQGADLNAQGDGFYSTALQAACGEGHKEIAEWLVAQGADLNAQGGSYGTALQAACQNGHKEIAEWLVAKGADLNAQGGRLGTALQAACGEGHKEIAEWLVAQGADLNAQGDGFYSTALQAACGKGHKEIAEWLVAQGADVNVKGGEDYGTALQAACGEGHKEIAEWLVAQGADVNVQGDGFYSTALQAACGKGHKEIAELLVAQGADLNAQGGSYGTALQAACRRGRKEIAEWLVAKGADLNAQGGRLGTALQAACWEGHKEIAELLVAQGADVNVQGGEDYGTALQAACWEGHKEIAEWLVAQGADVNVQGGEYYGTAFQAACGEGHKEIAEWLVSQGADAACVEGHKEIAEWLVAQGADVNAQSGECDTALQAACLQGYKEIAEWLVASGVDVNAQGGYFGTALQAACLGGYKEIIELLVVKGADVNVPGGKYGNALQTASRKGYKKIAEFLVAKGADVNLQGGKYGNALQAASVRGHKSIVDVLVARGVVINFEREEKASGELEETSEEEEISEEEDDQQQ